MPSVVRSINYSLRTFPNVMHIHSLAIRQTVDLLTEYTYKKIGVTWLLLITVMNISMS